LKINLIFNGTETRVQLDADSDVERKILAVVNEHSSLNIESIKQNDGYSGWNRPYDAAPTSLIFYCTKPAPTPDPELPLEQPK